MTRLKHLSRWWIGVVGVVVVCGIGYLTVKKAVKAFDQRFNDTVQEVTRYPTTSATVKRKEYVRFDENNYTYINDLGIEVKKQPGEVQWRVYYEFDNFDQIEEPRRSRLLQAEKERTAKIGLRFASKSKEWFETIDVGDKLEIRYHPIGDNIIEVINVISPKQPLLN